MIDKKKSMRIVILIDHFVPLCLKLINKNEAHCNGKKKN